MKTLLAFHCGSYQPTANVPVKALRRVYRVAWHWSIARTAGLFLAYILINVYLYRPALFLLVFART